MIVTHANHDHAVFLSNMYDPITPRREFTASNQIQKFHSRDSPRGMSKEEKSAFGAQRLSKFNSSPSYSFGAPRVLNEQRDILNLVHKEHLLTPSPRMVHSPPSTYSSVPCGFGTSTRFADDRMWAQTQSLSPSQNVPASSPLCKPLLSAPIDILASKPGVRHPKDPAVIGEGATFDVAMQQFITHSYKNSTTKFSKVAAPVDQLHLKKTGIRKATSLTPYSVSPANPLCKRGVAPSPTRRFDIKEHVDVPPLM